MARKRRRRRNPAGTTAVVLGMMAVAAGGAYMATVARKRQRRKSRLYYQTPERMCPEGTVFDGESCVEPSPLVYPRPPRPPDPDSPTPTPTPTPTPGTGDTPDPLPSGLLPLSAADDPCIAGVYVRKPTRVPVPLFQSWSKRARDFGRSRLYYIDPTKLSNLATLIRRRYTTWPSLRHVVVRDALDQVAPNCRWYVEDFDMGNAQQNVFTGALDLAHAIEIDLGWSPPTKWGDLPMGYDSGVLQREILGLPSPGTYNLTSGQVVELIAIDPSLRFAEHWYGRVTHYDRDTECFYVQVIPYFGNKDVKPRFGHRHGIELGQTHCLLRTSGDAYRVYPVGAS